jgi:hypothetical protein
LSAVYKKLDTKQTFIDRPTKVCLEKFISAKSGNLLLQSLCSAIMARIEGGGMAGNSCPSALSGCGQGRSHGE